MSERAYSPGLEGVIAGITTISEVDPEQVKLTYRGYLIDDLAEHASYEEVCYLLLYGELPTRAQLDGFAADLTFSRTLPDPVVHLLRECPTAAHPMDTLRTGLSFLALFDPDVTDNSHDANLRKAKRLIAQTATMVAAIHRLRQGQKPVAPRDDFAYAKNLLYMIHGTEPTDVAARAIEVSLILYAEHTYNASAFTGRVIASTLSDMHSAVVGGVGALKGPLHGGANEEAMRMLLEIGEPEKAEAYVRDKLARKERIMGFGHRIYKKGDSRVPTMKRLGKQLGEQTGQTKWHEMAETVEAVMVGEKGIYPNVDFPCGYVYYLLGLPIELYTPLFAAARMVGWCAHIIEQHDDNRLIRPDCIYKGERGRKWVEIEERGA